MSDSWENLDQAASRIRTEPDHVMFLQLLLHAANQRAVLKSDPFVSERVQKLPEGEHGDKTSSWSGSDQDRLSQVEPGGSGSGEVAAGHSRSRTRVLMRAVSDGVAQDNSYLFKLTWDYFPNRTNKSC